MLSSLGIMASKAWPERICWNWISWHEAMNSSLRDGDNAGKREKQLMQSNRLVNGLRSCLVMLEKVVIVEGAAEESGAGQGKRSCGASAIARSTNTWRGVSTAQKVREEKSMESKLKKSWSVDRKPAC